MEIINQILGWIIIVGTFITYSFQYKKIYNLKTIVGINDNMLLLGCSSSAFNLMGIIGSNLIYFQKYNTNLYFKLLPIIQILAPWICLQIIYSIYFIYDTNEYSRTKFKYFNIAQFIILLIVFPITVFLKFNDYAGFSDAFNIIAAITNIAMWIPQIITTCINKTPGSLSLLSVGFHSLGCILVIVFQLLEKESFTTIIPYIVSAICEGWLVGYCTYIGYLNRKNEPLLIIDY
jgi:hypothetical protein